MTTARNIIPYEPQTPWTVYDGQLDIVCIEDANERCVCTIPPTVKGAREIAERICRAMNGPDLWDTVLYQERQTGQVYFGARWKELHAQVMNWEFEQIKHDKELNREG